MYSEDVEEDFRLHGAASKEANHMLEYLSNI